MRFRRKHTAIFLILALLTPLVCQSVHILEHNLSTDHIQYPTEQTIVLSPELADCPACSFEFTTCIANNSNNEVSVQLSFHETVVSLIQDSFKTFCGIHISLRAPPCYN